MAVQVQPADLEANASSHTEGSASQLSNDVPSNEAAPKSCCKRVLCALVVLGMAIGAVLALVMAFVGDEDLSDIFDRPEPPGLNETDSWYSDGRNGLEMVVLNALEDKWTPIFDEYIQAWDNGRPDALTLSTVNVTHDFDCTPVHGRIKVCNGNYGETNWRGINEAFLQRGYIQNSAARMNDYFLENESQASKRFTMCHELGHAFGLPHTDESYLNLDRGDCLDYTLRPWFNAKPGEHNFNLLSQMYGEVNDGNRQRRLGAPAFDEPPKDIVEKYSKAVACIESKSCFECKEQPDHHVRMLHKSDKGEACEVDLGEEYSVRISKLLVT